MEFVSLRMSDLGAECVGVMYGFQSLAAECLTLPVP